jgi:L-ascorbate metabolism protein UlaG (beta-lactamase superfamily)
MTDVVLQWLGTAGFRIEHADKVLLIDPFLTRTPKARPVQELRPADFADADLVFVSHGHFDHLADVPEIVEVSGAQVCCSRVAASTLMGHGVPSSAIRQAAGGETLDFGTFSVSLAASRHIRFDARLILTTLPGVLKDRGVLRELGGWPAGPVLVHSFDFGGLKVTHMGSLGVKPEDAAGLGLTEPRPDILMPPLQGHTDICSRAAALTAAINPRGVVPQHHDDFSPPISRSIDIEPFRSEVARLLPDCAYYEPVMNQRFTAADIFGSS